MSFYFRQLPNLNYNSLDPDAKISEYVLMKNLFRRGKLREDILSNLTYFTKYSIIGDERPDSIAYKFYEDESLDWVILLSNNIVNVFNEWPMGQDTFNNYLLEKYLSYENIYSTHHYETIRIQDSLGNIIVNNGLVVEKDFKITFFDAGLGIHITRGQNEVITKEVSNYDYELSIEDAKRNIYVLKPEYLNVVFNDMEEIMTYKSGSDQYINDKLKTADNSRFLSL
jgi:hypothetical protein